MKDRYSNFILSYRYYKTNSRAKNPNFRNLSWLTNINVVLWGNLNQEVKYAGLEGNAHRQSDNDTYAYKHPIKVEVNSII